MSKFTAFFEVASVLTRKFVLGRSWFDTSGVIEVKQYAPPGTLTDIIHKNNYVHNIPRYEGNIDQKIVYKLDNYYDMRTLTKLESNKFYFDCWVRNYGNEKENEYEESDNYYVLQHRALFVCQHLETDVDVIFYRDTIIIPTRSVINSSLAFVFNPETGISMSDLCFVMPISELIYQPKNYRYPVPIIYELSEDTITANGITFTRPEIAKFKDFKLYKCDDKYVIVYVDGFYSRILNGKICKSNAEVLRVRATEPRQMDLH